MDYTRTLEAVNSSIKFLGTGASKLTGLPIFDEAVRRCASANGELRFLLRKPDSQSLVDAARRAGRDESAYRATVITSLRKLAEVRNAGAPTLEVRFYDHDSAFRMVMIDNSLALLSYNVYAARESADRFPQLHVRNRTSDATKSFFWAFDQFFDEEWKRAAPWDFQEYL